MSPPKDALHNQHYLIWFHVEGTARASHKGLQMLGHPGIPVKENFQPLSGQEFVEGNKNGDQDHRP